MPDPGKRIRIAKRLEERASICKLRGPTACVARRRLHDTQSFTSSCPNSRSPAPRSRARMRSARARHRRCVDCVTEFKDDCLDAISVPRTSLPEPVQRRGGAPTPTATQTRCGGPTATPTATQTAGAAADGDPLHPGAALRPRPRRPGFANCPTLRPSRPTQRRISTRLTGQSHDSKSSTTACSRFNVSARQRPPAAARAT